MKSEHKNKVLLASLLILLIVPVIYIQTINVFAQYNNTVAITQAVTFKAVIDTDFEFNSSGTTITGYNNNNGKKEIIFPSTSEDGTPITSIASGVINYNSSVERVIIPASITSLGWLNFMSCSNLKEIIVYAENPICEWTSLLGWQINKDVKIYVPDNVLNRYKDAEGWKKYKKQIYGLSELN